ncbi:hypothetical protein DVH05_022487 [Phytophthora capsici]|nr:hypothetical protein DVH05_022487 [Phytophthora capsici]
MTAAMSGKRNTIPATEDVSDADIERVLRRYGSDIDDIVEDGYAQAILEEAVEARIPRVDVIHLYFSVLEYAATRGFPATLSAEQE